MPSWTVHFDTFVRTSNPEVVYLTARCHALASVIANIPITPRRQSKLDRLNILRAVRGTTGIEGAQLTEEEVGRIIDAPRNRSVLPPDRKREEQEARNAEKLMHYVAGLLDRYPTCSLSEDLVRKLHKITTEKIDYENNVPGRYRDFPVTVAAYVPPREGSEVRALMARFVSWFNQEVPTTWDAVIRAIVAHFYVVSIHPFAEGNGRTSRAVESFLLRQAGINVRGFYSLANFYYQNREEYVRQLDHTRFESDPDLTPFVVFALKGLAQELEVVHLEVILEVREIAFRDFAREVLHERLATKAGERMLNFVLQLEAESVPLADIRRGRHPLAALYRGVTAKTLSRDINYLREHQLIITEEGIVRANFDIMDRFVPSHFHFGG